MIDLSIKRKISSVIVNCSARLCGDQPSIKFNWKWLQSFWYLCFNSSHNLASLNMQIVNSLVISALAVIIISQLILSTFWFFSRVFFSFCVAAENTEEKNNGIYVNCEFSFLCQVVTILCQDPNVQADGDDDDDNGNAAICNCNLVRCLLITVFFSFCFFFFSRIITFLCALQLSHSNYHLLLLFCFRM